MIKKTGFALALCFVSALAQAGGYDPFEPMTHSEGVALQGEPMPKASGQETKRFSATRKTRGVWEALIGDVWVRPGEEIGALRVRKISGLKIWLSDGSEAYLGDSLNSPEWREK